MKVELMFIVDGDKQVPGMGVTFLVKPDGPGPS